MTQPPPAAALQHHYSFRRTSSMGLSHVEEDDAARAVAAVKARVEQVRARTVLALFSVSLLWCSSLSAADALVGAVLPTPHRAGSVAAVLNETFVNVRRAEEDYAACADRQSRGCVATLRASAEAETQRATAAEARNNATVRAIRASADTCVQLEATLVRLMRTAQAARAPSHVPWRTTTGETGSGSGSGSGGGTSRDAANTAAAPADAPASAAAAPAAAAPTPAPPPPPPSCAAEERAAVDARVSTPGDSLATAASEVSSAADVYRRGNDEVINRTLDLLLARADYDAAYAANKTGALAQVPIDIHANMSEAAAALAGTVSQSLATMDVGAGAALTSTATEGAAALAALRDQTTAAVEDYVGTVKVYVSETTVKMAAAEGWFRVFKGLGVVLNTINVGAIPDVEPPAPPVLEHTQVPGIPPDVTARGEALTAAAAARAAEVSRAADATRSELARGAARIPEAAAGHIDAAGVPTLLDDYDPPPRVAGGSGGGGGTSSSSSSSSDGGKAAAEGFLSEVRADAKARADAFANQTATVAGLIEGERSAAAAAAAAGDAAARNVTTMNVDAESMSAAAAANLRARLGAAAGVGEGVEWLGISPPDVDAAVTALAALYAAVDGLVGADLAYRAARSAQLVARHFDSKGHTLPPIDLTSADGNTAARESSSVAVKIAQALGHPACLAAVRAVAASLAATLVSYAYLPFHEAYRRGCVVGCDGTFVTLNMHSIAHNYAAAAGFREMAAGVGRAEGERRDECSRRAPASAARLAAARGAIRTANEARAQASSAAALIVRCVDPDGYNTSVGGGGGGGGGGGVGGGGGGGGDGNGFTSDQLSELHRLMRSDAWTQCGRTTTDGDGLLDAAAEFDCGALPACAPTCVGPARRVLAPLTHTSGCAAEGLAHATALRTVLVGLVFFAANAARDAAVRGMAAVCWRALSGGAGYRFEGTLRPDGSAARPDTGGRGVGQVARGRLRLVKKLHVRGGWWALGLAAAAQLPGLVALIASRQSSLVTTADCSTETIAGGG